MKLASAVIALSLLSGTAFAQSGHDTTPKPMDQKSNMNAPAAPSNMNAPSNLNAPNTGQQGTSGQGGAAGHQDATKPNEPKK